MTVEIKESAGTLTTAADGSMLVQIISEGTGSSGKYPGDTLKLAAQENVFHKGLHVYMDHPTATEAMERPERSVMDLSGTLTTDAVWNEQTRALEARYKPYPSLADAVRERSGDIGLSIRAMAEQADDGTIQRITEAQSVDLVTRAGRGGKVLQEADRGSVVELLESTRRELIERNGGTYQPRHAADPATTEPEPDSSTAPAVENAHPADRKEKSMAEINESELSRLQEAAGRVETLEAEKTQAVNRAEQAEAQLAESTRRVEADAIVAAAFEGITAPKLKARLVENAIRGAEFDADAFKAEAEEMAAELSESSRAPKVEGFGDTTPVTESADQGVTEDDVLATIEEGRR